MTAELTIFICVIGLLIVTFFACGDSIMIFRNILRQRLVGGEKIAIVFLSLILPGFNILGYAHFHEKDLRQSLYEFKKWSLYRDFIVCHIWFYGLFICSQPGILWDVFHDLYFAFLLFCTLIPISLVLSFFSFAVQLPNFFDRHTLITDESDHKRN